MLTIIDTKTDLKEERIIGELKYGEKQDNIEVVEVSAKDNTNIKFAVDSAIQKYIDEKFCNSKNLNI